jgi:iron(III) transport system permease protein
MLVVSLVAIALVAAPLVSLIALALHGDAEIWPHLVAYVVPNALLQTTGLIVGTALVAGIFGTAAAWLVTTFEFRGRAALLWLLPLPLAIPTYIAAYIYVDIFEVSGPLQSSLRALAGWPSPQDYWFPQIRSLGGAIFIFGVVLYPYVYLAVRAMLQTQPAALTEAARSLGASQTSLLRQITLPLARPALAVGIALVSLETLNDIGASEYLGVQTLTLSVFTTWLNRSSLPGASQIALVMLMMVTALIALERYGRRRQAYTRNGSDGVAERIRLTGRHAALAAFACLVPATLGFLFPAAYLARETLLRGLIVGFEPELIDHALTTVTLAAAATVLVLVLAGSATLLLRQRPHRLLRAGLAVSALGYAVPGTVLALGLLSPLVLIDEGLGAVARAVTGQPWGLIVIGSGGALVIAYAARFMAIGSGFLQAGLARVPGEFDDAARVFGAQPIALTRSIHLPLIRPALWGAALLVFVDCLKELPATLMLRPLNVETLSTYVYQFATRGSFEDGALAALLIVAAGLVPVVCIVRQADLAVGARRSGKTGSKP